MGKKKTSGESVGTVNGRKTSLTREEWMKIRRDRELDRVTDAWLRKHDK
jgi:hypothetical protein